jgi:hypothetical protein
VTTPDIHVRELELRMVHRGAPWLDREDLMRSGERIRRLILADLERLLGKALAGCAPDAALGQIDLAIELGADGVKVRPRPEAGLGEAGGKAATAMARSERRSGPAASGTTAADLAPTATRAISPPAAPPGTADAAAAHGGEALLDVLLEWHAEASLARRLALLPAALPASWRRLLCAMLAPSHGRGGSDTATRQPAPTVPAAAVERLPQRARPGFRSETEALVALVALVARHVPHLPPVDEIEALMGAPVADPTGALRASPASSDVPRSLTPAPARRAADRAAPEVASRPRAALETAAAPPLPALVPALPAIARIANALPFLMLGPLDRIGWLEAAGAALAAATRARRLRCWPARRGWRWSSPRGCFRLRSAHAGRTSPPSPSRPRRRSSAGRRPPLPICCGRSTRPGSPSSRRVRPAATRHGDRSPAARAGAA